MADLPPYLSGENPDFVLSADVEFQPHRLPAHQTLLARCCTYFAGAALFAPAAATDASAEGGRPCKMARTNAGEAEAAEVAAAEPLGAARHCEEVTASKAATETFLHCVYNWAPNSDFKTVSSELGRLGMEDYCGVLQLTDRYGFERLQQHLLSADVLGASLLRRPSHVSDMLRIASEAPIQALQSTLEDVFVRGDMAGITSAQAKQVWQRVVDKMTSRWFGECIYRENAHLTALAAAGKKSLASKLCGDCADYVMRKVQWPKVDIKLRTKLLQLPAKMLSKMWDIHGNSRPVYTRTGEAQAAARALVDEVCGENVQEQQGAAAAPAAVVASSSESSSSDDE